MDKRAETIEEKAVDDFNRDLPNLIGVKIHDYGIAYKSGWDAALSRDAWTPVERLPEMDGSYVVTVEPMDKSLDLRTETAMWESRHDGWLINGSTWGKVIAWMPLPAPYEQEK
jgi:hypothetical protein